MRHIRIRIFDTPAYVCADKEHHHDQHLDAFVGLELPATEDSEDNETFAVKIQSVLLGMMRMQRTISMAAVYWQMRWVGHSLSDHLRIPKDCCEIIDHDHHGAD